MQELVLLADKFNALAVDQVLSALPPLRKLELYYGKNNNLHKVFNVLHNKVQKMEAFSLNAETSMLALPASLYPKWVNLTSLHLAFCSPKIDDSEFCIKMALQSEKLRCIDFPHMTRDEGLVTLLEAQNSLMTTVKIPMCALSPTGLACLVENCKNIETLEFDASQVEPSSLIGRLQNLTNLTNLTVNRVLRKLDEEFVLDILDKLVKNADQLSFVEDKNVSRFEISRGRNVAEGYCRIASNLNCSCLLNHPKLKNVSSVSLCNASLNDFGLLGSFEKLKILQLSMTSMHLSSILVMMAMAREKKFEELEITISTEEESYSTILLANGASSLVICLDRLSPILQLLPAIFDFLQTFPLASVDISCKHCILQHEVQQRMASMPKLKELRVEQQKTSQLDVKQLLLGVALTVGLDYFQITSDNLTLKLERLVHLRIDPGARAQHLDSQVVCEIFESLRDSGVKSVHLQHDGEFDEDVAFKIAQMTCLQSLYTRHNCNKTIFPLN